MATMAGPNETNIATLPKKRSDGYRDYYANNCQIRFTPFDVTILFTFLKELDGEFVNEAQTAVTLSPLQFKALVTTGATLMDGFEKTFGQIAFPPGIGNQPPSDQLPKIEEASADATTSASSSGQPLPVKRSRAAQPKKAKKL
jgi:hypothetical protein